LGDLAPFGAFWARPPRGGSGRCPAQQGQHRSRSQSGKGEAMVEEPRTASARPPTPDTVPVSIPLAVVRALRPAARVRDTTVPRLIADLVEVVAADDLVTAPFSSWTLSMRRF
jgi:hypothetical protein